MLRYAKNLRPCPGLVWVCHRKNCTKYYKWPMCFDDSTTAKQHAFHAAPLYQKSRHQVWSVDIITKVLFAITRGKKALAARTIVNCGHKSYASKKRTKRNSSEYWHDNPNASHAFYARILRPWRRCLKSYDLNTLFKSVYCYYYYY